MEPSYNSYVYVSYFRYPSGDKFHVYAWNDDRGSITSMLISTDECREEYPTMRTDQAVREIAVKRFKNGRLNYPGHSLR
jgi:hypothetical protein